MAAFESFECVNTEEADSFIAYLSDTISLLSSSLVMAEALLAVFAEQPLNDNGHATLFATSDNTKM